VGEYSTKIVLRSLVLVLRSIVYDLTVSSTRRVHRVRVASKPRFWGFSPIR